MVLVSFAANSSGTTRIDRFALVNRHHPVISQCDPLSPFSVGNGDFAFTADVTGLQTFPAYYLGDIPLGTLSHWGWHTIPSKETHELKDTFQFYDHYGRTVPYASQTRSPAGQWLRANPHKLHLGRIGFDLKNSQISSLKKIKQKLDLWQGILESSFQIHGKAVNVTTLCHPKRDMIAVRVNTAKENLPNLPVSIHFPYGSESWGPVMADWDSPNAHKTILLERGKKTIQFKRVLDKDTYFVRVRFSGNCSWVQKKPHEWQLVPSTGNAYEFSCEFSAERKSDAIPHFSDARDICAEHWEKFWTKGGAVDLSESQDARANELERRIVLSQYLTAIQCASTQPPQESGLTHNSWYGKFHLEMHWWHAVHFALWDRLPMLEKSVAWYNKILPQAKQMAKTQGYKGARWPKMVGPDGRESPSGVGVFLIWQQPHPIYYAELCYRDHPDRETLNKYQTLVFETAEFMASYAHWDQSEKRYILGPPLIPAQECYPPKTTFNPAYELAYWSWGLQCAQRWRQRLGLKPHPKWQHVIDHLASLPQNQNLYVTTESTPNTFANPSIRRDHPSLVAALGLLPDSEMVERTTMRRTLHKIFEDWEWESTWGWDYPMLAMTAARVGEPELAIQSLLMDTPKNHYLPNGHCYQRENLPTYLPANGGLLTAIAMMAAGWDDRPNTHAPGFPQNGRWKVRWENLRKMP
ncbi:glycoside hydrolase family 65 [bacterium]|nr:glycoside hydrolase family 65 [bacterium]